MNRTSWRPTTMPSAGRTSSVSSYDGRSDRGWFRSGTAGHEAAAARAGPGRTWAGPVTGGFTDATTGPDGAAAVVDDGVEEEDDVLPSDDEVEVVVDDRPPPDASGSPSDDEHAPATTNASAATAARTRRAIGSSACTA